MMAAAASARCMAAIDNSSVGRMARSSSTRVSRTSVWMPGSSTGIVASVSVDSASFASTQSRRSRVSAAIVAGSSTSRASRASPSAVRTWLTTASSTSMPPSRSTPSGRPRIEKPSDVLRMIATSKVPPPRSYTAISAPGLTRSFAA